MLGRLRRWWAEINREPTKEECDFRSGQHIVWPPRIGYRAYCRYCLRYVEVVQPRYLGEMTSGTCDCYDATLRQMKPVVQTQSHRTKTVTRGAVRAGSITPRTPPMKGSA